jgi:sporulation protein YlmC with PRC-barrel domain
MGGKTLEIPCYKLRGMLIWAEDGNYVGKVEDVIVKKTKNSFVVSGFVYKLEGGMAFTVPSKYIKKIDFTSCKIIICPVKTPHKIELGSF